MISRREFLTNCARLAPIIGGAGIILSDPLWQRFLSGDDSGLAFAGNSIDEMVRSAPRARYWTSLHKDNAVRCFLCPHNCIIGDGERGKCGTRVNVKGGLRSLVYGRPVSIHVDPIEKKPFYHFLPGAEAYSLATAGCPLQCKCCQNWEISQARPEDYQSPYTPPEKIVRSASASKARVIAFTYNEPTVFAEYMIDIARDAKKQGLRSVLISCGFVNEAPLAEMCSVLDAIKIDLKGYSEDFYRTVCGAELKPVLKGIKQIAKSRAHLEIVNLVVPTLNDSDKMLLELIDWVLGEVGHDVPLHFSRFHPAYQMLNLPPTPVATLERARDMAISRGIHYPYVGNVPSHPGDNTYCPSCKKVLIQRQGFFITEMNIKNGRCKFCNRKIAGVWV
ncbi:MAG: AmmeMemoRadiSam system radical SAM enzyme [Syntrophales bacterium]